MKGFVYRLQKVLEYRIRIEDEKKQAFVKARLEYLKEIERLQNLQHSLDLIISQENRGDNIFSYITRYNYYILLEERIEDQSMRVKIYEDEMNKKKYEFQESQKARKVLDKLKDNAQNEFMESLDRIEQKQNDEFALYGYMRK